MQLGVLGQNMELEATKNLVWPPCSEHQLKRQVTEKSRETHLFNVVSWEEEQIKGANDPKSIFRAPK